VCFSTQLTGKGVSGQIKTTSPAHADRTLEESAGAQGEDRKRAVDANRTCGGERSETAPKPDSRKGSGKDDPRI
jgi:hypothetical protein